MTPLQTPAAKLIVSLLLSLLLLNGCTTTSSETQMGVQPGYEGFIPARIAVLACQPWPQAARYARQPLSNATAAELSTICQTFDAQVLEAFSNQPYMHGFTPKYLARLLGESQQSQLLTQALTPWNTAGKSCTTCADAASLYKTSIATQTAWQTWLNDLSRFAKRADAALLPFITYAYTQAANDRGLLVAERVVGLSLLLVNTATGELIWAGTREAAVPNKQLETASVPQDIAPPAWSELDDLLFTADLWRGFPGRQVYE